METRKYILPCQRCADQAGDTCRTPKGKQAFESVRIEKLKKKKIPVRQVLHYALEKRMKDNDTFNATTSSGSPLTYALNTLAKPP